MRTGFHRSSEELLLRTLVGRFGGLLVAALSLVATPGCSEETGPELPLVGKVRFHIESDSSGVAAISLTNQNRSFSLNLEMTVPGTVDVPIAAGTFRPRIRLGDASYNSEEFIIDEEKTTHEVYMEFGSAVVTCDLPSAFNEDSAVLDLKTRGAPRVSVRIDSVGVERPVEFVFRHLPTGTYFPTCAGIGSSSSSPCPLDSLTIPESGSYALSPFSYAEIEWTFSTPWEGQEVETFSLSLSGASMDLPVQWDGGEATAFFQAPCGSFLRPTIHPRDQKAAELSEGLAVGSEAAYVVSSALGGIELDLLTSDDEHSYQLYIGNEWIEQTGPIRKRFLYRPGQYSFRFRPRERGLAPPAQDFSIDGGPVGSPVDVAAFDELNLRWVLRDGGTLEGTFLDSTSSDRLWFDALATYDGEWNFVREENSSRFVAHHTPIDSFRVSTSRNFSGRAKKWWYPGTWERSEATYLFIAEGDTLRGIDF